MTKKGGIDAIDAWINEDKNKWQAYKNELTFQRQQIKGRGLLDFYNLAVVVSSDR